MTEKLLKSDFFYDLPEELIAQDPLEKRDDSRLLVLEKDSGAVKHDVFHNIASYLKIGDCLVLNDTKVIPARLLGIKENTKAAAEILLLSNKGGDIWEALVRPGKKLRKGACVLFGDGALKAEIIEVLPDGNRLVKFFYDGIWEEMLDRLGEMPLPPYIKHKLKDRNRYQTVYAKYEGSAAAPTAGLHFTNELLQSIRRAGIDIVTVTLHVGLGTFRPVKEEHILDHQMHSEWYDVPIETAERINAVKKNGGRVVCVGTTSCRTLEASAIPLDSKMNKKSWQVRYGSGNTDIFIHPGYDFKITDALITNFHLPESTLLMLVAALGGYDNIMRAYKEAVRERYRFFSFGDAMFIQ